MTSAGSTSGSPNDLNTAGPKGPVARSTVTPIAKIMGVLNVTPDSFSDGGAFHDLGRAVEHALQLVEEGADILDIGGESTRPGADPVPTAVELQRVLPVIEALRGKTDATLSIDTMKSSVARAAALAGATMVNDVSAGLADPEMLATVGALRKNDGLDLSMCLMHRQGASSKTMQVAPSYVDPVAEVRDHLRERANAALEAGIPADRIVIDPGVGFGKRLPHNLALLARLGELRELGYPILLGASRKSFIGHITGAERITDWQSRGKTGGPQERSMARIGGTAAAVALAAAGRSADILRVHDVAVMREAILVAEAISGASVAHSGGPPQEPPSGSSLASD